MKGNEKIAFTAEAVAYMREYLKIDDFSKYFVSQSIRRKFGIASWIIPKSYLNSIFQRRTTLSKGIDKLIEEYDPEQIIELACGYSTRGLLMTQRNPNLVYVETDFPSVIEKKKEILKEIEKGEGIKLSKNHYLVGVDAISGNLSDSVAKLISGKKKTLVVAETLNSYLNPEEHTFLVNNVEELLDGIKECAYLNHEGKGMLPGFFGKLLLFYRDKVAKTRSYSHFSNPESIKEFFKARGFRSVKVKDNEESKQFIYLAIKKVIQ